MLACDGADRSTDPTAQCAGSQGGFSAGAAGSGCGAQPQCAVAPAIFPTLCGTSVCHDGAVNGVDLIAEGLDARLVDAPASGVECADSGLKIVDRQHPEQSLLLLKLSDSPPCGAAMPFGSGAAGLLPEERVCIEAYVYRLTR